jgi:hypothetical protein
MAQQRLEHNRQFLFRPVPPAMTMLGEGRVYGSGLHKLEPKELANVPAAEITGLIPGIV